MSPDTTGTRPADPPEDREVAVVLNVDPDVLSQFVAHHPNPDPGDLLELSERPPTDEESRETVAEWLAAKTDGGDGHDGGNHGNHEDPDGESRGLTFQPGSDFYES